ncbi:phosphoglycerate kinase [Candidatus Pacearchaeota archaeon]|nr:phosphoglycerate kinase [Candidatus Pacearchaeota archaeon]|tara:strand:- start:3674 stop:4039 length:366 start_codon:yes stop_codon:yes gene_type:complete
MGLDQYAYVSNNGKHDEDSYDIAYWRKHNRLHGWMEQLYRAKGGNKEFNCADVELTLEDIELLESTILNKMLPETGGFFFGSDSYSDYEGEYGYKDDDVKFINLAREELNKGNKVFYNSWW